MSQSLPFFFSPFWSTFSSLGVTKKGDCTIFKLTSFSSTALYTYLCSDQCNMFFWLLLQFVITFLRLLKSGCFCNVVADCKRLYLEEESITPQYFSQPHHHFCSEEGTSLFCSDVISFWKAIFILVAESILDMDRYRDSITENVKHIPAWYSRLSSVRALSILKWSLCYWLRSDPEGTYEVAYSVMCSQVPRKEGREGGRKEGRKEGYTSQTMHLGRFWN